jgi:hypothetical protein
MIGSSRAPGSPGAASLGLRPEGDTQQNSRLQGQAEKKLEGVNSVARAW